MRLLLGHHFYFLSQSPPGRRSNALLNYEFPHRPRPPLSVLPLFVSYLPRSSAVPTAAVGAPRARAPSEGSRATNATRQRMRNEPASCLSLASNAARRVEWPSASTSSVRSHSYVFVLNPFPVSTPLEPVVASRAPAPTARLAPFPAHARSHGACRFPRELLSQDVPFQHAESVPFTSPPRCTPTRGGRKSVVNERGDLAADFRGYRGCYAEGTTIRFRSSGKTRSVLVSRNPIVTVEIPLRAVPADRRGAPSPLPYRGRADSRSPERERKAQRTRSVSALCF